MKSLYDIDFSRWADETAQLLTEKRFEEIDLPALIEEVQDLAGRLKTWHRGVCTSDPQKCAPGGFNPARIRLVWAPCICPEQMQLAQTPSHAAKRRS